MSNQPASEDPRVIRTRTTVLNAAADLLAEQGFSGFSLDALVARTGVSKTTIYRHWPSRRHLLAATIPTLADRRSLPDTGTLRGDLGAFLRSRFRATEGDRWARGLPGLIEAAERDPELVDLVAGLMDQTRSQLSQVLERAIARGELAPDLDQGLATSVIIGPILYRRLISREKTTGAQIDALLDMILKALDASFDPEHIGRT